MSELDAYDYCLPAELIAQEPLPNRADARLLVVRRADLALEHRHVRDLPELLSPGDGLVLNDTRVVPARLIGRRTATGGRWEGLFLEADDSGRLRLLCKTRGRLQPGETIDLVGPTAADARRLRLIARAEEGSWIAAAEGESDPWQFLQRVGQVPLPHYIRGGQMRPADRERYQTVYAQQPGSVAAPTAGLHFTAELLERLQQQGIDLVRVTLHVGIGTFRPIKVERLSEHRMHAEFCQIEPAAVERLAQVRQRGGRIVAVGTTSVRTLESAAQAGVLQPYSGATDLFIRPPYAFRSVDCLLTNFHLPRSTLLVLVRTFGGEELLRRAYAEAIAHRYRFYSYGDAMLIL